MQTKQNNSTQACQGALRRWAYRQLTRAFLLGLLSMCIPAGNALAQDFTNTGTMHLNDGTTLHVAGMLTNNSAAPVTNDGNIEVAGAFDFQNGEIDEPNSGIVIFLDNATATNAANASHVDSMVRKIGDDAFTFPTGDGSQYGPVSISAPGATSDQIDTSYWLSNPQNDAGPTLDAGLTGVSSVEYWNVSGSPSIDLTLHWDSDSAITSLLIGDLADLRVVGWDNTKWVDLGNDAFSGDATSGTITANGITPNTYAAYTIGSVAAKAQLEIKITVDPAGPLGINDIFTVTVTVTNPGTSDVSPVPIEIGYNNTALTFFPEELSVPPDDLDDDGTLTWSDITQYLGALMPGVPESMMIRFTALQDTTSIPAIPPCNVAGVSCLAVSVPETGTLAPITDTVTVDVELGLQNKYILGDFIWEDESGDGVKDVGEAGINGVLLNLYLDGSDGSALNGTPEAGEFLLSTTTANNANSLEISQDGYYSFSVITGPGKIYIVEIDDSNFGQGQALEGMVDTGSSSQSNQLVTAAAIQQTEIVVPMTTASDHLDADFSFATAAANVALDVTLNTVGPARQTDPISFTVTITNLDATPLSSLPVDVVFPDAYLDCTTADHAPTVADNQMSWADLLGTAGVTLNQNDPISFVVNCIAGLDTTLLPNQQAVLRAIAANTSDSDGISIFAPTSVLMAERSVEYDASTGRSTLRWQASDESQMVGFHVYRRIEPIGLQSRFDQASSLSDNASEWVRLTDQPLVANSAGRASGETYEYVDQLDATQTSVLQRSNSQPHYKLGILTVDGVEVYLDLGQANQENRVDLFVPFIVH